MLPECLLKASLKVRADIMCTTLVALQLDRRHREASGKTCQIPVVGFIDLESFCQWGVFHTQVRFCIRTGYNGRGAVRLFSGYLCLLNTSWSAWWRTLSITGVECRTWTWYRNIYMSKELEYILEFKAISSSRWSFGMEANRVAMSLGYTLLKRDSSLHSLNGINELFNVNTAG